MGVGVGVGVGDRDRDRLGQDGGAHRGERAHALEEHDVVDHGDAAAAWGEGWGEGEGEGEGEGGGEA